MKNKLSIFALCAALLMSGCGISTTASGGNAQPDHKVNPTQTVVNLERVHMNSLATSQYPYTVQEFDVGTGTYVSPAGKKMPYHLNGIIGVPEGSGPFPLVLITHGSHSNDNENLRFDTGYRYLVEALAEQGFVAVSMDMSKAYTWKYGDNDDREKSQYLAAEHLKSLMQAEKGEPKGYPVELAGKIDFGKIGLIGHSRGGETIFDIAEDMQNEGTPARALLCIAPTFLFADRTWPDAQVALIIPEYDGDVIGLDGFALYDVLGEKTQGEHLAVYLKGANHNYFNSNIQRNDGGMLASTMDLSDQLAREEQEAFLQAFAADFFYLTLQKEASLLPPDKAQPETMFGRKASVLYRNAQSRVLLAAGDTAGYTTENLQAETKKDAWYFKQDELLVDTITFGEGAQQSRQLLKLGWADAPGVFQLAPSVTDWKEYAALALDLVVDAADEKNRHQEYQRFAVRITDAQGNTARVNLPDQLQTLMRAQGELDFTPVFEEKIYFWSVKTPLASLILPLSSFEGVNLAEVKSLDLLFEDTPAGSLLIESVRLQ
ncbi:hypothetical protein Desde_0634 [Desulfitobacterium dehalogenans ATCC 51507]|uniref:Alpha/beta hydrolase n=1 Tax=Desulfitobacterium dehalogenans (strain ATCC 51507 / DSM 9161 / JW/IU-DC1) TaxID=756499 RepID=I4A551_DESDJ|nr:hypothetical protein [Desulfitobacterium dehalogenans]AFL99085.1 hypothetical protein Desde_0634 [Desulfitobacterium dehalogenans ATCC 51507]